MNRIVNRGVFTITHHSGSTSTSVFKSSTTSSLSIINHGIGYQKSLMRMDVGPSDQVRFNFWQDFVSSFKQIVNENPQYQDTFQQARKKFLWWKKDDEVEQQQQQQQQEGQDAEGMQTGQFKHTYETGQQQQQQREQTAEEKQQYQQEQYQKHDPNKDYTDEELKQMYGEEYVKKKKEMDRLNKYRGASMSKTQTEQLNQAYKATLGVRPPYPPHVRRDYSNAQDLVELSFMPRVYMPLRYEPGFDLTKLSTDIIEEEEVNAFADILEKVMKREEELIAKGVDLPEIDWSEVDCYEKLEQLPIELRDSYNQTEEELEKEKLPIPVEKTNTWLLNRKVDRVLDFFHKVSEYLPTMGGNYIWYTIGRLKATASSLVGGGYNTALTKFYLDHKEMILPGLEVNKFLNIAKSTFIPEFLDLYFVNNLDLLKEFTNETTYKILKGTMEANETGHKIFDGRVVRIEHMEFLGIAETEDYEETYFSFMVSVVHTHCIRDFLYDVVEGSDNELLKTNMIVHLSIDVEANDFGWVVAKLDVHPSEPIQA